MQLRNISLLIAFCMLSWKVVCHFPLPAAPNPSSATVAGFSDGAPLLLINQSDKVTGYPILPDGWLSASGGESSRIEGEKLYEQQRYPDAIKLFRQASELCPHDITTQLDLGKAYLANKQFTDSISSLADVRRQCRKQRERAAISAKDLIALRSLQTTFLDMLPEGSCQSMDFEARRALEQAVEAELSRRGGKPLQQVDPLYKNDRRYRILTAALALGRAYHQQVQDDQAEAIYQLAKENSLGLPPSVVSSAVVTGSASERWDKLAQLAANAMNREEKHFYYERLKDESLRLPKDDIRVAATMHAVASEPITSEEQLGLFSAAFDSASTAGGSNKHYLANCAYDSAIENYNLGLFLQAHELLQKALANYETEQSLRDEAQTHYCLGLVEFALGNRAQAKHHFITVSRLHVGLLDAARTAAPTRNFDPAACIFVDHDFALNFNASYNAAVLATEYEADPVDRQFMLDYGSKFSAAEAAAQVGLYFFKLGDDAKAEEYWRRAADVYFPYPEQAPSLQGATNGTIGPEQSDTTYSQSEILAKFFAHQAPPADRISSRYAPCADDNQITEGHTLIAQHATDPFPPDAAPSYIDTVEEVYQKVLLKRHKLADLALFKFAARESETANKSASENTITDYLNTLHNKLVVGWHCPKHHRNTQMVVRLRIGEEGNIRVVGIDRLGNSSEINQSVQEAIQWASPLPAPPPGWNNRELVAVFNADDCSVVENDPTLPGIGFAIPAWRSYY